VIEAHGEGLITHGKPFAVGRTRQSQHGSQCDGEDHFAVYHLSGTQQMCLPCVISSIPQNKSSNGAGTETAVADGGFAMCLSDGTRQTFKRCGDRGDGGKGDFDVRHDKISNFAMCPAGGTRQSLAALPCVAPQHAKLTFKSDRNGRIAVCRG